MTQAKRYGGPESRKPNGSTQPQQVRYMPTESMLALQPKAFGLLFASHERATDPAVDENGVAVIDVCGPLMHRKSFFFDSYDEIKARASAAIEAGARAIVLSIDSPGGLVSGAFDTARELRAMCEAAQCELRAHIGGTGASAAYAVASAASWIGVSQTAIVGSIGIIDTLIDATEQNKMFGLNVQLVASGARKADGNPDQPISDGALEATQSRVNEVAEMFFALVEQHGWGNADDLRAMQGAVVTGQQAVAMGLASEVATLGQAIAFGTPGASSTKTNGENEMPTPMEDAIESLRKAAESEDEEEAKRAKIALAALEDEEAENEEDDTEAEGEEDDKEEAKAEGEEYDKEEAKSEATAKNVALQALAEVHRMKAEREAEKVEAERAKLIASRPDFSEELVAILQTSDMDTVKKMVATLPKGKPVRKTRDNVSSAASVIGTRGADTGAERASRLDPEAKANLDRMMGLHNEVKGIKHDGNRMVFGASVPAKGDK